MARALEHLLLRGPEVDLAARMRADRRIGHHTVGRALAGGADQRRRIESNEQHLVETRAAAHDFGGGLHRPCEKRPTVSRNVFGLERHRRLDPVCYEEVTFFGALARGLRQRGDSKARTKNRGGLQENTPCDWNFASHPLSSRPNHKTNANYKGEFRGPFGTPMDFAAARKCSTNFWTTGLTVRCFSLKMATGKDSASSAMGSALRSQRAAFGRSIEPAMSVRKRPVATSWMRMAAANEVTPPRGSSNPCARKACAMNGAKTLFGGTRIHGSSTRSASAILRRRAQGLRALATTKYGS